MVVRRTVEDLKDVFKDVTDVAGDTIVYEVNNKYYGDSKKHLMVGTTIVYPGDVNFEYFMTKGHKHVKPTAEVYYCLEGTGIVVLQDENDRVIEHRLEPGEYVYCGPKVAHRVVNDGDTPLKFLCVCRSDSGHDYNVKFKKRYFVEGDVTHGD